MHRLRLIIRNRVKPRFLGISIVVKHDDSFAHNLAEPVSFTQFRIRRIKCGDIRHDIIRQAECSFCRFHTQVTVVIIIGQIVVLIRQRSMRNYIRRSSILDHHRFGQGAVAAQGDGLALSCFGHG